MKKAICIAALAAVLAAGLTFAGCNSDENFVSGDYSADGAEVDSIAVDVSDREVTISPSADADVHVSYYESEKEYYAADLSGEGVLSITLETDKDWTDYIGTKPSDSYRKLNISVPEGILHDLTVKTTNENVKVSYIDVAGTMSLDSNGGGIVLESVSAKSVDVRAKNGNIGGTLTGSVTDYTITCEYKKGDCNLSDRTGGEKTLYLNCNNGDISVFFTDDAQAA